MHNSEEGMSWERKTHLEFNDAQTVSCCSLLFHYKMKPFLQLSCPLATSEMMVVVAWGGSLWKCVKRAAENDIQQTFS